MQQAKHQYYTHKCCEVNRDLVGKAVTIAGWVDTKRDHGSLIFIDLRDSTALIQCLIDDKKEMFPICEELSVESVVSVTGVVTMRSHQTINPDLLTGEIEIKITGIEILSEAESLPFALHQHDLNEEMRLKYRFLDLRRGEMQEILKLRADTIKTLRNEMERHGFIEVHTPLLTASSPEGARDYVVPSRLHKGKCFALPQSPQLFKQLLMVAGVPKYYQIAPCLRDEDTRADRAPGAFYQLDLEMAFATQEDVLQVVEDVIYKTFRKLSAFKMDSAPFKRIKYREALAMYGSDKPDLRNPLQFIDIRHHFTQDVPQIFKETIENGGNIFLLPTPDLSRQVRKFFDDANHYARSLGMKGLGYLYLENGFWKGSLANIMPDSVKELIEEGAFIIAHKNKREFYKIASQLRDYIGEKLDLIEKNAFRFCWIVDFPMYEQGVNGAIDFSHNPFSMPQGGLDALNTKDPLEILAWQYDIVCNGVELSSGAVRNHRPDIMYKAFEIAGYSQKDVDDKFGAMISAFRYGAPPHAGCAPGIDRMVMLLADVDNVRQVIPFPLNQQGMDLMMGAPSTISKQHADELGITFKAEGSCDH